MAEMWIPEEWCAALKCARQSIQWALRVGMSLREVVGWYYSDVTVPGSDDWITVLVPPAAGAAA